MRKSLHIIFILIPILAHAQVDLNKFDEIVLVDFHNTSFSRFYGRTYLLKLNERPCKLYDLKIFTGMELLDHLKVNDSTRWSKINSLLINSVNSLEFDSVRLAFDEIKKLKDEYMPLPEVIAEVDLQTIEELKAEVFKQTPRGHILDALNLSADSINNGLDKFLVKYLSEKKIKYKHEQLRHCKDKLSDYSLFNKVAASMTGSGGTIDDYPFASIEFRNNTDTVKYHTNGQHSFMLPWMDKDDKAYSYNPNLSIAIGRLIPGFKYSNRERLLGYEPFYGSFLGELYLRTIEFYCIDKRSNLVDE